MGDMFITHNSKKLMLDKDKYDFVDVEPEGQDLSKEQSSRDIKRTENGVRIKTKNNVQWNNTKSMLGNI